MFKNKIKLKKKGNQKNIIGEKINKSNWTIKKYIYIHIYHIWNITQSKLKRKILPSAITWVKLQGIMLNKQPHRERQIIICRIKKKKKELI